MVSSPFHDSRSTHRCTFLCELGIFICTYVYTYIDTHMYTYIDTHTQVVRENPKQGENLCCSSNTSFVPSHIIIFRVFSIS